MAANHIQIQNALQKQYDRILFAKEVLNPVFGSCFSLNPSLIKADIPLNNSEKNVIDTVGIYGNINLEDGTEINCYEIVLQPHVRIEYSKVAIQRYVRKLLTAGQAALINFVSPLDKNTWRLTFVAKDSELTEEGIKEKTTHAKRYTYLLGTKETCKTAAERFERLSIESEITFNALVNAFSVEKLSKAFFDEYTLHYQNFVEYLNQSNFKRSVFKGEEKAIRDFTKKLLGRIVFLYFVQKKGWLGATDINYTDGMTDFMKSFFLLSGGDEAFYNNWLSTLFFETLNKERANDDFLMPDGKILKVPFLNGGLFDKEEHDNSILTFNPKLFHNPLCEDTILTPKNRNVSRGFLDFLNAFNFTVHEDSPDEHTVAVDPEMLGHIFENLLEDNKDKGAFYTPKEIVHYMCQESLIEYATTHLSKEYTVYQQIGKEQIELFGNEARSGQLKMEEDLGEKALNREDVANIVKYKNIHALTKTQIARIGQLLDTVKICDPAIGSGAFPMGLLLEIFAIKEVIAYELQSEWNPAQIKENIIQNCIYGVDIEKGAVDIARLRFWLSLVVNEEKPRALPNLDYKIMQGNSLLESYEDLDLCVKITAEKNLFRDSKKFSIEDIHELKKQVKLYFKARNSAEKKSLQSQIEGIVSKFIHEQIDNKIKANDQIIADKQLSLSITNQTKPQTPAETKKKEAAIQKLEGVLKIALKEADRLDKIKAELRQIQKTKINPYFLWHLWFYDIFEKGGFDIVIGNPPYVQLQKMSEQLKKGFDIYTTYSKSSDLYCLFYEKGNQLLKIEGVLTYITSNSWMRTKYGENLRIYFREKTNPIKLLNFEDTQIFATATVESNILIAQKAPFSQQLKAVAIKPDLGNTSISEYESKNTYILAELDDNGWIIGNMQTALIKKKMEAGSVILKSMNYNIVYGIRSGLNEVFIVGEDLKENLLNLASLNFEIIKPILRGRDIDKFYIKNSGLYIILSKYKQNEKLKQNYPTIYYYLTQFEDRLKKRGQVVANSHHWIELDNSPSDEYLSNFSKPKIIWIVLSDKGKFAYDEKGYYTNDSCFIMTGDNLKYLLAVLNSKLAEWYFAQISTSTGMGTNMWKKYKVEQLPIKTLSIEAMQPFERVADYILFLKTQTLPTAIEQLMPVYFEQIIDGMVYELYFPDILKQHKREIIAHLGELPAFTATMHEQEKMEIVKTVFHRLNDREHLVRVNLFYMNSIPEIAIIEGKHENN